MSSRFGAAALSVVLALFAHAGLLLASGRSGVMGTGELAAFVDSISTSPTNVPHNASGPLRVVIGRAEKVPVEGPGPRATLSPGRVRRPPALGPAHDDLQQRAAVASGLFTPDRDEARRRLTVLPPDSAAPSWADRDVALAAVDIRPAEQRIRIGREFLSRASLLEPAARALLRLDARKEASSLRLETVDPGTAPVPAIPEPARGLRVPEIFVDILAGD